MSIHAERYDFDGTLLITDMARLLKCSPDTIRRRLRDHTFPVPLLPGVDNRLRWSGAAVKRWLGKTRRPMAKAVLRARPRKRARR